MKTLQRQATFKGEYNFVLFKKTKQKNLLKSDCFSRSKRSVTQLGLQDIL